MIIKLLSTILLCMAITVQAYPIHNKVVYGQDDRYNIQPEMLPIIRKLSHSVAAQVPKHLVTSYGNSFTLDNLTLAEAENLCPNERYRHEIVPAVCTAFLIASDILVTAGHCIKDMNDCKNFYWVFDFTDNSNYFSTNKSLYKCKKVLYNKDMQYSRNNNYDFAIIRLDRPTNRDFLPMRTTGKVSSKARLYVIGHPSGLPQKLAGAAKVFENYSRYSFTANLDTFAGNSGSPVIDLNSGKIEGILVRGETDYIYNQRQQCYNVNRINSAGYERVTRTTLFAAKLYRHLSQR